MNTVELFDQAVRSWPENMAIIEGRAGRESVSTFKTLGEHSSRLASLFREAGLKTGEGIVLMLPMSATLYAVIAAAWRIGLVPVFIDPAAGREHITQSLGRYSVRAFIGNMPACLFRFLTPALRDIPIAWVAGPYFPGVRSLSAAQHMPLHKEMYACTPDTPAMLSFTSGSTGQPKGILRTHGLLMATHAILSSHVHARRGEIVLATMPLLTLINLGCGVTSLIPDADLRHPAAIDSRRLYGQIKNWKVARVGASPALLERLADYCLSQKCGFDSILEFYAGGAPVFPRLLEKLSCIAPQARTQILYGSTEAEPIARISSDEFHPDDLPRTHNGQGLLVGHPIPEIKLRILHDHWGSPRAAMTPQELELDTMKVNEIGEIVVLGPHIAPSYLEGVGDAENKFKVGNEIWHRTGDAGWLDAAGRLWLVGRCTARIEDRDGVLYPYTIEASLTVVPAIVRSALLSHQGRRLLAVELHAGKKIDIEAIRKHLEWARISAVVIFKSIPVDRRHNAKIDYPALLRLLESEQWQSYTDCHRGV